MTGNEILDEFDAIVSNDFYGVYVGSTAAKLLHVNNAVRSLYERVKATTEVAVVHSGVALTVIDIGTLVPRLLEVATVTLGTDVIPFVQTTSETGWKATNRDSISLCNLGAGSYVLSGYKLPAEVAATDTPITDIDNRLLIGVIYYAVYLATGAHEDTEQQISRRALLHNRALNDANALATESNRTLLKQIF